MNIVPLNATTPDATTRIAELTAPARNAGLLSGNALRSADPAVQRHQVAQQFEAIILRQLLGKTMNSMLNAEKDSGGVAASVYGDMMTDSFANQLSQGSGLGLGRVIEKQLTPRSARAVTASPSAGPAAPHHA